MYYLPPLSPQDRGEGVFIPEEEDNVDAQVQTLILHSEPKRSLS